jgi:O-antigen/teichoic acid export membrane protein
MNRTHALDSTARSPAVDFAPPVAPDLARAPEIRKIHQNFVETLLFKGLSTPLALVLVVIQSRFLHPAGRGSFVLAILSVTILSRLLGQLGYAVTHRLQQRGVSLRRLVQAAFAIAVVLGTCGMAAVVAWGRFEHGVGPGVAVIAACGLVPNIVWQAISGVLLGLGRVRLWNVIQTLPPLLTFVAMLVIVVGLGGGVKGAVLAWTIAHVLTGAFALVATRDVWQPMPLARLLDLYDRPLARLALTMGAVQVVNLVAYRIELIVLDRERGVGGVGVYSIAVQTGEMLWLIAGALAASVTAPAMQEDDRQAATLIRRTGLKALGYTAVAGVVAGVVAPSLIPALLGHAFDAAARPLHFLLPGIVVYSSVTILVVYISVKRGRPHLSLAVSALGMLVTLAAAVVLIPHHGAVGAAIASTLGYVVGAALSWTFLLRLAREPSKNDPLNA